MSEYEKSELIKRKEMLFRFLSFMQLHKDSYADNEEDFEEQVDAILDQIIRINYRLNQFNSLL
jgi:alpha-glucosidase (family GH31 glycosyl hydrolase)